MEEMKILYVACFLLVHLGSMSVGRGWQALWRKFFCMPPESELIGQVRVSQRKMFAHTTKGDKQQAQKCSFVEHKLVVRQKYFNIK